MPGTLRMLLRFGGLAVVAVALLANLPGPGALILGLIGIVLFFVAGPT